MSGNCSVVVVAGWGADSEREKVENGRKREL
jgi:hypothetical protein